jgi:predicted ATPase
MMGASLQFATDMTRPITRARISFSGPGGSGKTSLAHALSQILEKPFISEVVRTVGAHMGLKSIQDLDLESRVVLQTMIAVRQRMLEDIHQVEGFVSDRSLLDAVAYYSVLVNSTIPSGYRKLCETGGYEVIYFVPPRNSVPMDGFRLENRDWEKSAEEMMRSIEGVRVVQGQTFLERISWIVSDLRAVYGDDSITFPVAVGHLRG